MASQTTQASQAGHMLTPNKLRPVNALTRASPRPGFLDYATYLQYLVRDGHVESSHPAYSQEAPAQPLNSHLQQIGLEGQNGDKTDFRADQALWSQDDLPHVLYLLQPPANWIISKDLKEPPMKQYRIHGKLLRDIPILPDHISSKVEGWRVQAWYSFDSRLKLGDILARIGKSTKGPAIMMRMLRCRTDIPVLGWANKGPKFNAEQLRIEGLMGQAGLDPASGTTRGLAWGLVDPNNEGSRRIPIANRKEWESSVEVPTAAHLAHIPSAVLPGYSQAAAPNMPLPPFHQHTRSPAVETESMIFDDEEEPMEAADDWLAFETPEAPAIQPPSIYPRPEEVSRPLSVTNPLQYQQLYGVEKKPPLQYHPCF